MGTPLLRPPLLSAGPLELEDRSSCLHCSVPWEIGHLAGGGSALPVTP